MTLPLIPATTFGTLADGRTVTAYTLANSRGLSMRVLDYGGIVQSLNTPDRNGAMGDIVLGFYTQSDYAASSPYFGALIGRYGNRIAKGRFTLDGQTYSLAVNNGVNALHGGIKSFDKVLWRADTQTSGNMLTLHYTSPDGEEGYPGTLQVRVTYTLTDDNTWVIDYHATADKATPLNLTQHSYFNLTGVGGTPVRDHRITIHADRYTPVDATLIPTGELAPVEATPFDLRTPTAIGLRIDSAHPQMKFGGGYDHNFVLRTANDASGTALVHAARVYEPTSGRTLDVHTTEPGLQFYSGNFLDGTLKGKAGAVYAHRTGFCLETQHFPDSPNQPAFPSTILRPGQAYTSRTVYTFGTANG